MMKPLISTPEQAASLKQIAESWKGTAYVPDGAIKGTGCSCSMLPYAILTEYGMDLPAPPRRGKILRCELLPMMLAWLMAHEGTHLLQIEGIENAQAGDILLYDAGTGHLAICVDSKNAIHSWQNQGAHVSNFNSDTTLRRLKGIWRPIIQD